MLLPTFSLISISIKYILILEYLRNYEYNKINVKRSVYMTYEQNTRLLKFMMMDDLDFYEEFILKLSNEQQEEFFKEVPDFMIDFIEWHGRMDLLRDRVYREILRKIRYADDKRNLSSKL